MPDLIWAMQLQKLRNSQPVCIFVCLEKHSPLTKCNNDSKKANSIPHLLSSSFWGGVSATTPESVDRSWTSQDDNKESFTLCKTIQRLRSLVYIFFGHQKRDFGIARYDVNEVNSFVGNG